MTSGDPADPAPDSTASMSKASSTTFNFRIWGVADQGLSSLTNFLLALIAARQLGASEFGLFSLALGGWFIAIGCARAMILDPMTVLRDRWAESPHMTILLVGSGLVGGLLSVVGVVVGEVVSGDASLMLLALAISLPALLLQEFWRRVAFNLHKPKQAFYNDLTFLAIQSVALGVAVWSGYFSATIAILCWAAGALAGAFLGFAQFSSRPTPVRSALGQWRAELRGFGVWLLVDFAALYLLQQGYMVLVALLVGLDALGGYQAVQTLAGPTNILVFGMATVALAEAARLERPWAAVLRNAVILTSLVTLFALVFALVSDWLVPAVYGSAYSKYAIFAVPVSINVVLLSFDMPPSVLLRALRRSRHLSLARMSAVPIAIGTGAATLKLDGFGGVGWAAAAMTAVSVGATWCALTIVGRRQLKTDRGARAEHAG